MRLYRGIAVAENHVQSVINDIRENGLTNTQTTPSVKWQRPSDLAALSQKLDLTTDDTRRGERSIEITYACGDKEGALYYCCGGRVSRKALTIPILIEFDADISATAVDGNDLLIHAFTNGIPDRARPVLENGFGKVILRYAERSWAHGIDFDPETVRYRLAQYDLASHDPEVISAHHASDFVLAGRCDTLFRSAFTIELPVPPESIKDVSLPNPKQNFPSPDAYFRTLIKISCQ